MLSNCFRGIASALIFLICTLTVSFWCKLTFRLGDFAISPFLGKWIQIKQPTVLWGPWPITATDFLIWLKRKTRYVMNDSNSIYTKWGNREVEMHELHPYINRTRIQLVKNSDF